VPEQFEGNPPLLAVAVEGDGVLIDTVDQADAEVTTPGKPRVMDLAC
jgi:hypothetical protein